jgi:PAS domain S-box-containing protein
MKNALDDSFRQLVEMLPAGVAIYQNEQFVYFNQAALNMMRASSPDLLVGTSVLNVVHPDSRQNIMVRMKRVTSGEIVPPIDERILRLDGTEFRAEIVSTLINYQGKKAIQVMFHDVTWRYDAAETIVMQEHLLRSIIDNVPAYITIIGADDLRYRFVNSAYERSFGKSRNEIEGALMKDILGEENFKFALPFITQARNGIACSYENRFEITEGLRWGKVMYSPGFAPDGHVETLIVLSIDITELKSIELALRKRETELFEVNSTKDKFISILAHDLKSPFSSLIGFSELLKEKTDNLNDYKIKLFVDNIYEVSSSTFIFLEELLEWARTQLNLIKFNTEQIHLIQIVEECILFFKNISIGKFIEIYPHVSQDIYIVADRYMLKTILRNLVSNAIKFTPKYGKIKIFAQVKQTFIEIIVSDTGMGMDSNKINSLFKIGETKSNIGTESERGTGFGLLLCKEFIEKHGGNIKVESQLGMGSNFKFTIPVKI